MPIFESVTVKAARCQLLGYLLTLPTFKPTFTFMIELNVTQTHERM